MDRGGWGVTVEKSDHHQVGFFNNKTVFGFNLSPRLIHTNNGSGGGGGAMFSDVEFPVNMNRREEHDDAPAVNEVDFFCEKIKTSDASIKNENYDHGDNTTTMGSDLLLNTGLQLVTANTRSDQSTVDDGISSEVEDKRVKNELAQLQVELERMNAENQRLKGLLTQVGNNYNSLQMHLVAFMQQQQQQQISRTESIHNQHEVAEAKPEEKRQENDGTIVPRQFMELGPSGYTGDQEPSHDSHSLSEERTVSGSPRKNTELNTRLHKEDSPESESWVPNKVPKLNSSNLKPVEQATEATMRKARVSVRARSEAPMISDGCQWRKYGQKMAKGNPCPRAYYRCTMAVGCPVRKQVQRCAEDRTILITTYEGTHNHPLPPAAMAMASTTSAAATMLLSGSMPSADGLMNPNFIARTILPNSSSIASISASAPFPTVTLDLTQNQNASSPYNNHHRTQFQASTPLHPSFAMPQVFGQAGLYNQSKFSGLQVSQEPQIAQNHPSFSDTLSAATAAITADPNFTAALAAAISSIIGGSHPNNANPTTNSNPAIPTNHLPGN